MILNKVIRKILVPDSNLSYAQFGEDFIISYLFELLKIDKPVYLDIGANHPRYISNTFYFYERGNSGVCIEPNPELYKKYKKIRPRDIVLNIGIGTEEEKEADFYLYDNKYNGLSTFSKEQALHWQNIGMEGLGKITYQRVIKIPLLSINEIIDKYFQNIPDLLSIDVEGMDLEILQSLDFNRYKPKVICAETLAYDIRQKGYKMTSIHELLMENGYEAYADTRVNTIFCLKELL